MEEERNRETEKKAKQRQTVPPPYLVTVISSVAIPAGL
jgi:hypothetical protein